MTGNLHLSQVIAGQNNKETTINDADAQLELFLTAAFSKDLTGLTSPYALTTGSPNFEAYRSYVYTLTGTLTGTFVIQVPVDKRPYKFINATSGGHIVTVKTVSGTGIDIAAGTNAALYCDGTNVVDDVGAPPSVGLAPAGGSTAEVLTKNSGTDYDYSWAAPTGGGGGSGSGVFSGVRLSLSGAQASGASETTISWDAADFDDGAWWVSGTNVVVPTGVTRIRVAASASFPSGTGAATLTVYINGVASEASASLIAAAGNRILSLPVGTLSVSPADVIIVKASIASAGNVGTANTYLSIEDAGIPNATDLFLVSKSASSGTSLAVTASDADFSAWDEIEISFRAIMSADNDNLIVQVSAATVFDTTAANYKTEIVYTQTDTDIHATSQLTGLTTLGSKVSGADLPIEGKITIRAPNDTTFTRMIIMDYTIQQNSDNHRYRVETICQYNGNVGTAIDGIKFLSSGSAFTNIKLGVRGRKLY